MDAKTTPTQIQLTRCTPAYWRVTFDNPPLNVMGPEMVRQFQTLIETIEADADVRVVVFDSAVDARVGRFAAKLADVLDFEVIAFLNRHCHQACKPCAVRRVTFDALFFREFHRVGRGEAVRRPAQAHPQGLTGPAVERAPGERDEQVGGVDPVDAVAAALVARPRFEVAPVAGVLDLVGELPPGATVAVTASPLPDHDPAAGGSDEPSEPATAFFDQDT